MDLHHFGWLNKSAAGTIRVQDFSAELTAELMGKIVIRLGEIGELLRALIVKRISTPTRSSGPSLPGNPPHADTGRLRQSVFWDVDSAELEVKVGTNLKYGLYLERGTNEAVITAINARVLSWVDESGSRRFARTVIRGPMAARPYLASTLEIHWPVVQTLWQASWGV